MISIGGEKEVMNNLKMASSQILAKAGVQMEKLAVDIANDAKKDHIPNVAHGMDRYENRSTDLTRSIDSELTHVDFDYVESIVVATKEYAAFVEAIYPYLWPAVVQNQSNFKARMEGIGYGKSKR